VATESQIKPRSGLKKWLPFPELTSLKLRDYRLWWLSSSTVMLNQFTTQMVLAWWVKTELGDPILVGTIVLAFGIPSAILLFPAGLVADKWDRKKQLMASQAVALISAIGLALFISFDIATFSIGVAFALISGSTVAFSGPARQALIPMLVPRRLLMNGVVLGSLSMNTSRLIAPSIAGLLMAAIGVNAALFFIAALLLVGIIALASMRIPHFAEDDAPPESVQGSGQGGRASAAAQKPGILATLGGGILFLWGHKPLLVLMVLYMATGLFITGPLLVIVPLLVADVWELSSGALGLAFGVQAATGMIMGFYLTRMSGLRNKGGFFALSMMGGGSSFALYSIAPTYALGLVFFMTFGVAAAMYGGMSQTLIQSHTPREVMGRVLSLNQLSIQGLGPIGAFMAGAMAQFMGPQTTGLIGGLIGLSMATTALLFARKFRQMS